MMIIPTLLKRPEMKVGVPYAPPAETKMITIEYARALNACRAVPFTTPTGAEPKS